MQWTRETDRERLDRLNKWHNWFAWYPIRLDSCKGNNVIDTKTIVWLERVKRRFHNQGKLHMRDDDAVVFQLNVDSMEAHKTYDFPKTVRHM